MQTQLDNRHARALFLHRHGLLSPAPSQNLIGLVDALGFVQVDSVNTLARAHDMILWARRTPYRPPDLPPQIERHRTLFEGWTHDAAVLPSAVWQHWRHKHQRDGARFETMWNKGGRAGFAAEVDGLLRRIARDGPMSAAEAGDGAPQSGGGWWAWKPTKTALEYLWRRGDLCICHREGFRKHYDLAERVIPPEHLNTHSAWEDTVDWACRSALDRLGFATPSELADFYDLVPKAVAKDWAKGANLETAAVRHVDGTDGRVLLAPGWDAPLPSASQRLRILSPFDPALRNRQRVARLFGFDYRVEMFVPAAKRRYGYYVFPILEGLRLTGRIDLKADRAAGVIRLQGVWWERGIRLGSGRIARLSAELARLCRFTGLRGVQLCEGPGTEALRGAELP
ncbi:MAG: winged helix-turn-helix domain-containing protein [Shimia sp.]